MKTAMEKSRMWINEAGELWGMFFDEGERIEAKVNGPARYIDESRPCIWSVVRDTIRPTERRKEQ